MPAQKQSVKKPISAKQLAANRANARKSTGPRSRATKDIVRFNGLKHGLAGKLAFLPGDDLATYEQFRNSLVVELAPANARELGLVHAIADEYWRTDRARLIEDRLLLDGQPNPGSSDDQDLYQDSAMQVVVANARTFRDHTESFMLLSLYEQRIQRALHRNRALLRRIQTERQVSEPPFGRVTPESTPHMRQ